MSGTRTRVLAALLTLAVAGVSGRAQGTPPAAAANPRPSVAFARLFDQYRHGDVTAAIAFSKWSANRIAAEALRPADVKDVPSLIALALLHTDAGIANGRFGLFSDTSPQSFILGSWGLEDVFEVHAYTAYKIVDGLVKQAREHKDAALLQFAKEWYFVAISACAGEPPPMPVITESTGVPGRGMGRGAAPPKPDAPPDNSTFMTAPNGKSYCVDGLTDKARHDLPDDADILVLLGTQREPPEMTQAQMKARHVPFDLEYGQKALNDFNDALKIDPDAAEALLRKGHLLHVVRNEPDAVKLLERALSSSRASRNSVIRHLAALFLGEAHEDGGDLAAAIPYYREALGVLRTHTASIALGQALIRSGHVDEGWAIGARMFGREGEGAEPVVDPYRSYRRLGYLQIDDRLAELRDRMRGQ